MPSPGDELLHLVKHGAQQQAGDFRPSVYGHVASYDPETHRVRLIIPSLRDEGGTPVMTPWMPLMTLSVGNGWGLQWAPKCGATLEKPTLGEQMQVHVMERSQGVAIAVPSTYNEVMKAPWPKMKAGEFSIKHEKGSFLYIHENGDVEINTQGKTIINATDNVEVTTQKHATITATDYVEVDAPELRCTGEVIAKYGKDGGVVHLSTHDHSEVRSGSDNTGPPVPGS